MSRPFHPSELSGPGAPPASTAELADVEATARLLEAQLAARDVHPSAGFADRVMDAVAGEPRPQPAIAAGRAMRRGRIGAMVAALADSWRVAFGGGRPLAVRAQAAAFVIVALLAVGSLGGIAAVGAVNLLAPARPQVASPLVAPTVEPHTPPPAATDHPQATETPEPSATPEPSETPDETRTPRPTHTEHPGETPEPTETDDGGGGGGSGGGDSGGGGGESGGSGGGDN